MNSLVVREPISYQGRLIGGIAKFEWSVDGLVYYFVSPQELGTVLSASDEAHIIVGTNTLQARNLGHKWKILKDQFTHQKKLCYDTIER